MNTTPRNCLDNFSTSNRCVLLLLFLALPFLFIGCATKDKKEVVQNSEYDKTIKLAYANWAEGVALTSLTAVLLEDHLGYQVETKMTDIAEVFELVGNGEYHLFADAWLPRTHGDYLDQFGSKLSELGILFDQARTGLVVPSYVEIQTISELPTIGEQINYRIMGIEASAGIMNASQRAKEAYSLDNFELLTASGPAIADSLEHAILRREPIVITGWVPHWIWAKFDLKFLEDPQGVYGSNEQIHALGNQHFEKEFPRAATLIQRMELNRVQLAILMDDIRLSEAMPAQTTKKWVQNNPALVNEWTRGLRPEREKVY